MPLSIYTAPATVSKQLTRAQIIARTLRSATAKDPSAFLQALEKGFDVAWRDKSGQNVLHHLAERGKPEILAVVLARCSKTEIDSTTSNGQSPLILAAKAGQTEMVRMLLNEGANVHLSAFYDHSALHAAATGWHVEIVDLLLKAGAKVDARKGATDTNEEAMTPLAQALLTVPIAIKDQERQLSVMRRLLDAGANPNVPAGQYVMHNLCRAVVHPIATLELLLERGATVDLQSTSGYTAMLLACTHLHPHDFRHVNARKAVMVLLQAGANPNLQTEAGLTALHMLAQRNDADMVNTMVKFGADLTITDHEGKTPIQCAYRDGKPLEASLLALTMAEMDVANPLPIAKARTRL